MSDWNVIDTRHSITWGLIISGFLLMTGCAQLPGLGPTDHTPPEVIDRSRSTTASVSKPAAKKVAPKPKAAKPTAKAAPLKAAGPPQIAILVSADIPAMNEVARVLKKRLGSRATTYPLKGNALLAAEIADQVRAKKNMQVVAIGLLAAQASKSIPHTQVFGQVFNFSEYGLLRDGRRGVSILPPADKVFSFWQQLSPGLNSVAVATGPNQQQLVRRLQQGAKASGVNLQHIEVNSDKELIYGLKQADQVQGIWLLPDNRVLSRRVIRELTVFSIKNGKQLAVFSEQLLAAGALLSFSTEPGDVATQILEQLALQRREPNLPSELVPLKQLQAVINPVVASRLGIRIPASLKPHSMTTPP
ncbi:ABC transporter substrate-binding protein [Aestuariirhabdus sp. LZHN29]|uniref:ABC transporter substrate-binding protein n=1 Tax=Aestuariirhabdus sp. LZHN29 TaxID=3417462 RepID=UPI003CE7C5FF